MAGKRIQWIDFCRVYTAFCVVVRHCDRPQGSLPFLFDLFNYRSLVFFFFLVSGYFVHASRQYVQSPPYICYFNLRRFSQLLLPFLFWAAVAVLVILPLGHVAELRVGDWSWLSVGLLAQKMGLTSWTYWDMCNVPLWFLRVLMVLALVSPLLCRLPSKVLISLILICFAGNDVLMHIDPESHGWKSPAMWLPFRTYESVLALGFFSAGLVIRRYADAERFTHFMSSYAWLVVAGAILLFIPVRLYGFTPPIRSSALVLLGVATTMSIGCLCERYFPRFCARVAVWGPAAFFVYVTHAIVLCALRWLLTGDPHGHYSPTLVIVMPVLVVLICLGLFLLLKRLSPSLMERVALLKPEKK